MNRKQFLYSNMHNSYASTSSSYSYFVIVIIPNYGFLILIVSVLPVTLNDYKQYGFFENYPIKAHKLID